jgi:SAM-dependent methyltransferase
VAANFAALEPYDTVIRLNVLEHVADEDAALQNMRSVLAQGGRAIILVPQNPRLFNSLDEALAHQKRYTRATLREALERNGFALDGMFDFNRCTTPLGGSTAAFSSDGTSARRSSRS